MYQGVTPVPDRQFLKDLKLFDDKLDVEFNREYERFVVIRKRAYGDPFVVWVVDSEHGQFRQPDQRDINALFYADLWRHGGVRGRIQRGEKYMADYAEKEDRDAAQDLRDITKDSKYQLRNTFRKATNEGGKSSEFARINVKPKGLTAAQIREARSSGRDPWESRKVA